MTAPLTPPECDLRGMPYMPLDVVRLIDSDLFALSSGDEFKAAVTLWCKAWLQVPAGSLPDDDRILAHLSGTGARWKRLKDMALRGFILCDDGRWYHTVIAEKAASAWELRLKQRAKAAKRWDREEPEPGNAPAQAAADPVVDATACATGDATAYARERESKVKNPPKPPEGAGFDFLAEPVDPPRVAEVVDAIWAVTPQVARNRSSTAEVRKALEAAGRLKDLDLIGTCVAAYYRSPDAAKEGGKYAKPPHAFIKSDRWKDWNPETRNETKGVPIVGGVADLGFC